MCAYCSFKADADPLGISAVVRAISSTTKFAFLSIVLAAALFPANVRAAEDRILAVRVAAEDSSSITLDVEYSYSGSRGGTVFVQALMGDNGKPSPHYGVRPGRVSPGTGRARVVLGTRTSAPALFSTRQILVRMYPGGGKAFLSKTYSFTKTWSKPGAELPAALPVFTTMKYVPLDLSKIGKAQPTTPSPAGSATIRRIQPGGVVNLEYPSGVIKQIYEGRMVVTTPGSGSQTQLYSTAQHPTPPSPPADSIEAFWLQLEAEQLLAIIRLLVDHDEESVTAYLEGEPSESSDYDRIYRRSTTISKLVTP